MTWGPAGKEEEMREAAAMIEKKVDELIAVREHLDPDAKNYRARWDAMTDEILSLMDLRDELLKAA